MIQMDLEILRLINEFQKEQLANRKNEMQDNKAFLEMVRYVRDKLK